MSRSISQREARRLRRRVAELERRERARLSAWGADYTWGSVHVATFKCEAVVSGRLWMAKQLDCVLVGKFVDGNELLIYAVPKEDTP